MAGNDLITAQALAEKLNLSVETVWRYTRENRIPYIELGSRQYRYKINDVINALSGAVREKESGYNSDSSRIYTYDDYLELPEEPGMRYEILDGELLKEPSPNVPHQRASRQLMRILLAYFDEVDPDGEIFDSPLDVTLGVTTVVQPDLLYVSGAQSSIIEYARIDGPPTLVVEILSPASARKDRLKKMRIYQQTGVKHFWIVNPEEKTLECFSLRNNLYALVAAGMDEDFVEHPEFPGLIIDMKSLW